LKYRPDIRGRRLPSGKPIAEIKPGGIVKSIREKELA